MDTTIFRDIWLKYVQRRVGKRRDVTSRLNEHIFTAGDIHYLALVKDLKFVFIPNSQRFAWDK